MVRSFVGIFVLFLAVTSCCSMVFSPKIYSELITSIYRRYGTKGIIFATSVRFQQFSLQTFMNGLCHDFSKIGIANVVINLSQLYEQINFFRHRIVRPMFVIFIRSIAASNEFAEMTNNLTMSYPIWIAVFSGSDNSPVCKFCRNPQKNIYHLKYDSELVVICCNSTKIDEWWSKDGNITKVFPVSEYINEEMHWIHNKSLYWRRYEVSRRIIRAAIVDDPVFFTIVNGTFKGFLGELWRELIRSVNFTALAPVEVLESGTWGGVINQLYENEADIGVGLFTMTSTRLDVVDFTLPLVTARSKFYMKKPDGAGVKWFAYFQAFEMEIWATIVAILLTAPVLLTLIKFKSRQNSLWSLISENYLYVWGIFCQQGLSEFPTETPLRIAFVSIFLTAMVVSAAYSGSLISFLTTSTINLPFTTMEEFSEQEDYKLISMRDSADYAFFAESDDPMLQRIFKLSRPNYLLPITASDGFQQICKEKLVFYISDAFKQAHNIYLPCEVVHIETGKIESLAMTLPRGSEYTGLINYHIQRFQDNGMLNRLKQKYFIKGNPPDTVHDAVSLGGIAPILAVLGGGILLSLLVLAFELLRGIFTHSHSFEFKKKTKRKKKKPMNLKFIQPNVTIYFKEYCP